MSTAAPIDEWMAAYLRAWSTNDAADIRALFTEDAEYFTAPFRPAKSGQDAILEWWLWAQDDPDGFSFTWETVVATPTTAVIRGVTDYGADGAFQNLWAIEFAPDGRASRFTEWWMQEEAPDGGD